MKAICNKGTNSSANLATIQTPLQHSQDCRRCDVATKIPSRYSRTPYHVMLIPQRFNPPVNTRKLVMTAMCNKTPHCRIRGMISRDANLTRSSRWKKYHRKPFHATMLCYAMLCKCYSTSFSIQSRVLFCSKAFFPPCSLAHPFSSSRYLGIYYFYLPHHMAIPKANCFIVHLP